MQGTQNLQRGFTLIEVMIVIAIIGILAAVALPTYQDYTKRAKVTELILAASACRTSISEVYQTGGTAPGANNWGCESAAQTTKYVQSVTTDANGVITVTAAAAFGDSSIDNKSISVTPYKTASATIAAADMGTTVFKWVCAPAADAASAMAKKYLPGSCRG